MCLETFFEKEVVPIQQYETTDIFLGAYLLSSGGDLSGISFNDRQIATFMFTGVDLYQLDRQYRQGTALVNPVHLRKSKRGQSQIKSRTLHRFSGLFLFHRVSDKLRAGLAFTPDIYVAKSNVA